MFGYYGIEKLYPTKLEVNVNGDFDIDLKQAEVEVEINTSWCDSEKGGLIGLNNILNSTLEIKNHNSATRFNSLFIEYKTYFQSEDEIRPSGIETSKADKWFFELDGIEIILPTDYLKWLYTNRNTLNFEEKTSDDQSHQSTGFIVPIDLILPLYQQYKKQQQQKRAIDIYKLSLLKKQ
jgi:hypothetical protein